MHISKGRKCRQSIQSAGRPQDRCSENFAWKGHDKTGHLTNRLVVFKEKTIRPPEFACAPDLYQAKGYPQVRIKRLRSIAERGELTDERQERGVHEVYDYSVLSAEIARFSFNVSPGGQIRSSGQH